MRFRESTASSAAPDLFPGRFPELRETGLPPAKGRTLIFDRLDNHRHYPLGSAWLEAFSFLQKAGPELAAGKYHLRGDDLFAIVMDYRTQPAETGELEAHQRYLDIQMLLAGRERALCHNLSGLQVLQPYDPATDAELFLVPTSSPAEFILEPGYFLALFPHDAHMPCLTFKTEPEAVRKVVIKMSIALLNQSA